MQSHSSHTVVGYGVMVNIGDSHSPARGSIPRIRELDVFHFVQNLFLGKLNFLLKTIRYLGILT